MNKNEKLMDMLTEYAVSHQNPLNIGIHFIGIPVIMLGVFIPLSWITIETSNLLINGAYITVLALFLFYSTLDKIFSLAFLCYGLPIAWLSTQIGYQPLSTSLVIAISSFFGGYIGQFIGHGIEKSMPVVLKHPIQANLAAPFFIVVEIFNFVGMRKSLFQEIQTRMKNIK